MTDLRLPEGFTLASERTPPNCNAVEVIYEPSQHAQHFVNAVAYYDTAFRPLEPWQTLDHNAVSDYGHTVLAWRPIRDEMWINRG